MQIRLALSRTNERRTAVALGPWLALAAVMGLACGCGSGDDTPTSSSTSASSGGAGGAGGAGGEGSGGGGAASCTDGIKNGNESDVDCGASCGNPCAQGASCASD